VADAYGGDPVLASLGQATGGDEDDLLQKWLRGTSPSAALTRAVTGLGQSKGLKQVDTPPIDNSGADIPAHADTRGQRVAKPPNTSPSPTPATTSGAGTGIKTGSAADWLPPDLSSLLRTDKGGPTPGTPAPSDPTALYDRGSSAGTLYGKSGLNFAWGGKTPTAIEQAGTVADIASGRPKGPQTIYDPTRLTDAHVTVAGNSSGGPGGYGESQTDWSKVANPMAFSAFRELPQQMMTALLSKDPLAIEKAKADIEAQKAGKIAGATGEAHLAIQERGRRLYEAAVDRMHTLADQQLQAAEKLPEIQRQRKRDEIMRGLESAKVQLQAEYGYQPRPLGMGGIFGGGGGSLDLGAYPQLAYPPG
jgi:hypothetical protein